MLNIGLYNPECSDEAEFLYNVLSADKEILPGLFWHLPRVPTIREFVGMFANKENRILFLLSNDRCVVGGIWLDGIVPGVRAMCSMAVTKNHRGEESENAARTVLKTIWEWYDLPVLWSMTPHFPACVLLRKLGFVKVSEIPGFAQVHCKPATVFVYRTE